MMRNAAKYTLALAVLLSVSACSGGAAPPEGILMPQSAEDFAGEPYQDVVSDLQAAGFTNIDAQPLGDLITGWLNPEDSVDSVAIDGDAEFDSDEVFPSDAQITVSYHSFPVEEEQPAEETAPAEAEPSLTPAAAAPELTEQPTITPESNEDLASLLAASDMDGELFEAFTADYSGRLIEFDGHIANMAPHGDYATRYDILIYAGTYETSTLSGPSFMFRDVNTVWDLHLTGDDIPDTIGVNDSLHIVARVQGYEARNGLFFLVPVSTEILSKG